MNIRFLMPFKAFKSKSLEKYKKKKKKGMTDKNVTKEEGLEKAGAEKPIPNMA